MVSVDSYSDNSTIKSTKEDDDIEHFIEGINKVEKDISNGVTDFLYKTFGAKKDESKKVHRTKKTKAKKKMRTKKRSLDGKERSNDDGSVTITGLPVGPPNKK